ncbi:nucleotide sugar dehydratase [Haemophilus paracuniculus]|uniref:Nucleotide sugar dehydratase n=1 Tax=Haemophilus paracuniculus TaxID=734 RepID=A0A1T0AT93_9PAST|nr:NAD-dependent epimerase/dehydratase family protein [Haemophilus paracuniculus]OOR99859.1 nucleotide sugar dehydratase [Haemophilus paracuniculus]
MNKYIEADVNSFLIENDELLNSLANSTILITGATGLIGSHLVYSILEANKRYQLNIQVLALIRNLEKAKSLFGKYTALNGLELINGDVLALPTITQNIDYIIHGASITSSSDFVKKPVDTIEISLQGTKNLLNLAKEKEVKSFVYLSSLEVYGTVDKKDVFEKDFGYIDFTNVRSSYSEGKRMAECLCISYSSQFNIPVKIARLAQTFGPGVDYNDNRVFAQFARSMIEKKDIVLHTTGETERNYCYTKDAVSALLYILLKGNISNAYNVANENTMISIKKMAEMVAKLDPTNSVKVVIELKDSQSLGYNPVVKIKLKTEKLEKLGWKATTNTELMFKNLIMSWQSEEY